MHKHAVAVEDAPQTEGVLIPWARRYDALVRIFLLGQEGKLRTRTLELARLQPGERVLDVGCGTGTLALAAQARVGSEGRVCGIDASPEMIFVARQKAQAAKMPVENVTFQVEPVERLPFGDASFDVVFSSLMMHHLPEPTQRAGLAEIYRVLRSGGRLVIVDFKRPAGLWARVVSHLRLHGGARHGVDDLLPQMQAAGFVGSRSGQPPGWGTGSVIGWKSIYGQSKAGQADLREN